MRCILVTLLAFYLSACASVHSNILAAENQTGYVYSGVNMDALSIKCLWSMVPHSKENEGTSMLFSVPIATIGSLIYLVDVPFSFVADTLYLPLNLSHESEHERWTLMTPCYDEEKK